MSETSAAPDKFIEECGVFAIYGHKAAASLTALGLHALQHRGQEASGIVSFDGDHFYVHRGLGLVDEIFGSQPVIDSLKGTLAIGHNRYATTGDTLLRNVQPLYADLDFGGFALGHNGNLTNAHLLRRGLVKKGALFQSTTDTETIVHLMAHSDKTSVIDRQIDALNQIMGAYALVSLTKDQIIGVRDPHGFRPLVLGRLGEAYILTSETCALDIIGATYVRDVQPGEMVILSPAGLESRFPFAKAENRFCIFEYIYFARPDSFMEGKSVYAARREIGAQLAREAPCPEADVVVPVPDSGVPAAIGYAAASGLPFELGIIRNHYVGRTFIQPTTDIRNLGVKRKHNANKTFLEGKKVVLVDDSIVRGTTSRQIVEMVRAAGALEVHMRISSPPTRYSCYYGIDTPSSSELLAHNHTPEEIAKIIGVDSLGYLSVEGMYKAVTGHTQSEAPERTYCDACFTGNYAVALADAALDGKVTSLRERAVKSS